MHSTVRRATTGAAVGVAWIAGLFVAAPLIGGFGIAGVAQWLIVRTPGWLATWTIEALGQYAKPLLLVGVGAAAVAGAAGGAVVRHRIGAGRWSVVLLGVLVTGIFVSVSGGDLVAVVVGVPVALAPPYLVVRLLASAPARRNRRRFLRRLGALAVVGTGSVAGVRLLFERVAGPPASERQREPIPGTGPPPTGDPGFDFDGMPPAITPADEHYVIDINTRTPQVDLEEWTLRVEGAVDSPYGLGYDELLEHEGSVDQPTTLVCISNEVGGDLIGTGYWTGVPLSELIERADPRDAAVDVVTHAADGYSEAIPIEAVEREDILIAYGMDGETLEGEHGFPARLLVPGRYGMKMTKWITRIEVVDSDHEAYWEARGWDEEAVAHTLSYVRGAERDGDRVTVGGVAFDGGVSGVGGISAVEVSVDGGDTFVEADLGADLGPHAWRRWRHAFDAPDRDRFEVVVRAIDGDGTVQTRERSPPHPGGATGWHRRTVEV